MQEYLEETIKRLEKIVAGFEKKHGDKTEVAFMCDLRCAIGVLKLIIEKYK